jgi:hypothetical protein
MTGSDTFDQTSSKTDGVEEKREDSDTNPRDKIKKIAIISVTLLFFALLIDAAIETFLAGSELRWWIAGSITVYLLASLFVVRQFSFVTEKLRIRFAWLREHLGWSGSAALSLLFLLNLLVFTAVQGNGAENQFVMLGQSTSTVFSITTILAILAATYSLFRVSDLHIAIRLTVVFLAIYSITAFGYGIYHHTPYTALLQGSSLWQKLPVWLQGAVVGGLFVIPLSLLYQLIIGAMEVRGKALRHFAVSVISLTLSLTIVMNGFMATVQSSIYPFSGHKQIKLTREKIPGQLEKLSATLDAVQKKIPKDTYDPNAVIEKVGRNPVKLFEWVRDNTVLVPYQGVLRDSIGVLMDRVGNSLDRSLLLDDLLRKAGHRTRLVRGTLSMNQAMKLADDASMVSLPLPRTSANSEEDVENDPEIDQIFNIAIDRVEKQSNELLQYLASYRRPLKEVNAAEHRKTAESLSDHWWVQLGQANGWIDFDPTLPAPDKNRIRNSTAFSVNTLPDNLFHRVTLRIVLELGQTTDRSKRTLLEYSVPAFKFRGVTAYVGHVPLGLKEADYKASADINGFVDTLSNASAWLPLIAVGDKLIKDSFFTSSGKILKASDANLKRYQDPQDMGQQVNEKLNGITDLLGGLPTGPSKSTQSPPTAKIKSSFENVTAEWLEYEISIPGQKTRTVQRKIFDINAPVQRSKEAKQRLRTAGLLGGTQIAVETTKVLPEAIVQRLQHKVAVLKPLIRKLQQPGGKISKDQLQKILPQLRTLQVDLDTLAVLRWQLNEANESIYVNQPSIKGLNRALRMDKKGGWFAEATVDIVANDIGVHNGYGLDHFKVRLIQGVADTVSEAMLFEISDTPANTSVIHEIATAEDIDLITLGPTDLAVMQSLPLPESAKALIAKDLQAGNVVVVPTHTINLGLRDDAVAWWRINPIDGHVVGVVENEAGGAFTQYLITLGKVGIVLALIDFIFWVECVYGFWGTNDVFFGSVPLDALDTLKRMDRCTAEAIIYWLAAELLAAKIIYIIKKYKPIAKVGDDALAGAGKIGDGVVDDALEGAANTTEDAATIVLKTGHIVPWDQMTKAQRRAFQHSYSRHADELGLPRWQQSIAEELRVQFNSVVTHIREAGTYLGTRTKPFNGKSTTVNFYEATFHGTKYYYYETLSGQFISAGKAR